MCVTNNVNIKALRQVIKHVYIVKQEFLISRLLIFCCLWINGLSWSLEENVILEIWRKKTIRNQQNQYIEYWEYCSCSSCCCSSVTFPPLTKHLNMVIGFVGVVVFVFVWIFRCYFYVILVLFWCYFGLVSGHLTFHNICIIVIFLWSLYFHHLYKVHLSQNTLRTMNSSGSL